MGKCDKIKEDTWEFALVLACILRNRSWNLEEKRQPSMWVEIILNVFVTNQLLVSLEIYHKTTFHLDQSNSHYDQVWCSNKYSKRIWDNWAQETKPSWKLWINEALIFQMLWTKRFRKSIIECNTMYHKDHEHF